MCPVVPFQTLILSHHSRSDVVLLASCLSHPMKEAWSRCNDPLVHPQNQMKSEGCQHLELWWRWHLETPPLLPSWLPFSSLLPKQASFRRVGNPRMNKSTKYTPCRQESLGFKMELFELLNVSVKHSQRFFFLFFFRCFLPKEKQLNFDQHIRTVKRTVKNPLLFLDQCTFTQCRDHWCTTDVNGRYKISLKKVMAPPHRQFTALQVFNAPKETFRDMPHYCTIRQCGIFSL